MRVVLDTNILVSALLVKTGHPDTVYQAWLENCFKLLCCDEQLDELNATLSKRVLAARIKPYQAGRLVNQLKELAETVGALLRVKRSPDPFDDFLLALSEAGKADYLVTGDKGGLLSLVRHEGTRIVLAQEFSEVLSGRQNRSNEIGG